MIRKGNLAKNTAIALAIVSVFGSTVAPVSAMEVAQGAKSVVEYSVDKEVAL